MAKDSRTNMLFNKVNIENKKMFNIYKINLMNILTTQ